MQHKPVTNLLQRFGAIEIKRVVIRSLATLPKKTATEKPELSNRQKFNQISPPIKLYEKLDKLGFGTLLKTKKFIGVHKQRAKRDQQRLQHTERVGPPPEPKYAVSV